jgi:pheromone a factor receptor
MYILTASLSFVKATKIIIGGNVALPAAIFCLCVHLERVSSIRNVRTSRSDKRRRQLIDGLLCSGVPLIFMALRTFFPVFIFRELTRHVDYIVQGHRFDIIEDFGCRPTIYVSIVSVFLIWVPPLFFSVGACILAG